MVLTLLMFVYFLHNFDRNFNLVYQKVLDFSKIMETYTDEIPDYDYSLFYFNDLFDNRTNKLTTEIFQLIKSRDSVNETINNKIGQYDYGLKRHTNNIDFYKMVNEFIQNEKSLRKDTFDLWTKQFCNILENTKKTIYMEVNDVDYVKICASLYHESE